MKGSYILLIRLSEAETISSGSLPEAHFPGGYYAYVGSALSGLESRLNRHLRRDKKRHWHIDYLLPKASITDIIIGETGDRRPETGSSAPLPGHSAPSLTPFPASAPATAAAPAISFLPPNRSQ